MYSDGDAHAILDALERGGPETWGQHEAELAEALRCRSVKVRLRREGKATERR